MVDNTWTNDYISLLLNEKPDMTKQVQNKAETSETGCGLQCRRSGSISKLKYLYRQTLLNLKTFTLTDTPTNLEDKTGFC